MQVGEDSGSLGQAQVMTQSITIRVDGRDIRTREGHTILEACSDAGISVPSLCAETRLHYGPTNGMCGLCIVEAGDNGTRLRRVKACITPVRDGLVVETGAPRIVAQRKVRLEALLANHNADCVAPCVATCPAHVDVQEYLRQVSDGNFEAAIRVIKERNPFPLVCGRVCPHPCEVACRRNIVDEPVAIDDVKRFAAEWDLAREHPWMPKKAPATGKRIAVVGAGPSGLSAAYYCAVAGHDVTVFEKQPHAGGMMRYGIPEYRLPKAMLDKEIATIEALGVRILTGEALGTSVRLEGLQQDFDAVYLAVGSWQPSPMHVQGDELDGVWLGIEYLRRVTDGYCVPPGRTVVVGGGNTAVDCARTALRNGAEHVTLLYRRGREEMPAEDNEVEEAASEGVEMMFLTAPDRIVAHDSGGGRSVHCLRMSLGEPDRSGRRRPIPMEGSDFVIEADTVIGAIGQKASTGLSSEFLSADLDRRGNVVVDSRTMKCSPAKIFAGGDCVSGPATVIQAIAAGRQAALSMDEFVTCGTVTPAPTSYACSRGGLDDLSAREFDEQPTLTRAIMPVLPISRRIDSFVEVATGLSEQQARAEARRCLSCGCSQRVSCPLRAQASAHGVTFEKPLDPRPFQPITQDHPFLVRDNNKCIACGRCVAACSEIEGPGVLGFRMQRGRLVVGTRTGLPLCDTDCISCGQCVVSCPSGALDFTRQSDAVFKAINDPTTVVVGFVAPAVRSVIADQFDIPVPEVSGVLAGAMRALGFDKVFDLSFAADLTMMEEATEFVDRLSAGGPLPQFTSCCPGWVNFVERRFPALIPNLSTCRSPQQMMGATVKNHFARSVGVAPDRLHVVSIVPCLAKKNEATRPEFARDGIPDVDAVLTTTEFLEMMQAAGLDPDDIAPEPFDPPYARASGAGVLFGTSGGVAEAAMRMAVETLGGEPVPGSLGLTELPGSAGIRHAQVTVGETTVRVAMVSGLKNAEPLITRVLAGEDIGFDLIEIMACPGGCIGGAGNGSVTHSRQMRARRDVLVGIDRTRILRTSQRNPDILRLYEEFYGEPNSALAHRLLHTSYAPVRSAHAPTCPHEGIRES